MADQLTKIKHLLFRAGFGEPFPTWEKYQGKSLEAVTREMFSAAKKTREINLLPKPEPVPKGTTRTREERQQMRRDDNLVYAHIRDEWMLRMATSPAVLREKMALFWHDHFACRPKGAYKTQLQYNLFQEHALGSFRDLLHGVAKDPGMLLFLNNAQNRKGHPNENFAREVMELFTLGRGHYTEKDIQQAARSFTGWGVDKVSQYEFKERFHDFGEKTIFGKTGHFEGEDVLNMLLDNRQTSHYLTTKIYREFVNEQEDPAIVNQLAKQFYESDYDIGKLMETIFTADWFYAPKNRGNHIKSPIEYIAGMMRILHVRFENERAMGTLMRILGQELFRPPNVAGWPGGRNWIDSTTLLIRLKLPDYMFADVEFPYENKDEGDAQDVQATYGTVKKVKTQANWQKLNRQLKSIKDEDLPMTIMEMLLPNPVDPKRISTRLLGNSRADRLQSYVINTMSLPEYQLC